MKGSTSVTPKLIAAPLSRPVEIGIVEGMDTADQLAKKAMGLEPTDRVRLVEAILYSLDKIDPEIEKSWVAESEARYEAYARGELTATDWEDIKKRFGR